MQLALRARLCRFSLIGCFAHTIVKVVVEEDTPPIVPSVLTEQMVNIGGEQMAHHKLPSGVTLHIEEAGTGRPIVFIPGVMMNGQFFRNQLTGLSDESWVVLPDMRAHGQSEKVLSGHTVANYAHDLRELFSVMSIERPILVGWSMGAMVLYDYLKQFGQDDVAGIIIVDQPPSDFAWEGYPFGLITVESLAEFVEALQMDQRAVAEEFANLMQHAPQHQTNAWMIEEICRVPAAVASTILVNQTLRDDRSFLPQIDVPALVLFGRDAKMTSPDAGQFIANKIPNAQFHIFEHSSHVPFLEEPEAFNRTVREFIVSIE